MFFSNLFFTPQFGKKERSEQWFCFLFVLLDQQFRIQFFFKFQKKREESSGFDLFCCASEFNMVKDLTSNNAIEELLKRATKETPVPSFRDVKYFWSFYGMRIDQPDQLVDLSKRSRHIILQFLLRGIFVFCVRISPSIT